MIGKLQDIFSGSRKPIGTGTVAGKPAPLFEFGSGAPQPAVWLARLTDDTFYHGAFCCEQTNGLMWLYKWEGIWDNSWSYPAYFPDREDVEVPQGSQNKCIVETGNYVPIGTNQSTEGVTGLWAINTAEFSFSFYMGRESAHPVRSPIMGSVAAGGFGPVVPMWMGYHSHSPLCVLEPRTPRWMPMFHFYYVSPEYESCVCH